MIRTHAWLHQRNGVVDPISRPFVGILLRHRGLADAEGAVVAGTIADEAVHDVEEGLIARPDDAVGEIVRVRRAAFTRDGVDRLHAFRALRQEIVRCHGHHLAFAHAGLQLRRDLLVGAVDHRRRHVEQHQLVLVLDLARLQHGLLRVAHLEPDLLQRKDHRQLGDVDADRHVGDTFLDQDRLDLLGRALEQPDLGRDRPAQAEHARLAMILVQPGGIEPVMLGRRAEVPDIGIAGARQQGVARELVARPVADHRRGDVSDVVLVEGQHRAQA